MTAEAKPIVFVHVMKCGGTSVRAALVDAIDPGGEGTGVFVLDGRAAKTAVGGPFVDDWSFRDALLPYALLALRPRVVMGHFRHRDRYAELLGQAHFVTVLREPVDRLVSLYRYRRHGTGVDLPQARTLDELVSSGRWAIEGHRYVSTFCGRDDLDPTSAPAIAAALDNLRTYAAVGCVERLDQLEEVLSNLSGRAVVIPRLNTSPSPEPAELVDPGLRSRLEELCAPDRALYEALFAGGA